MDAFRSLGSLIVLPAVPQDKAAHVTSFAPLQLKRRRSFALSLSSDLRRRAHQRTTTSCLSANVAHSYCPSHRFASSLRMMASFMGYFGGRRDPKQSAREAIVTLRQQLQMLEKKEANLQTKIDAEMKTARANAVSNKAGACPSRLRSSTSSVR